MKQVIGGNLTDTTSATLAYLTNTSGRQFHFANLYLIGETEDPRSIWLTDWESSLTWSALPGTFTAASIKRATVSMSISLEVQTMDVSWAPLLTAFGTTLGNANVYQKAIGGYYRNWKLRVWRTIMPTPGDANTYGAYELFGGRVAITEVSRASIKFTVNSFLDTVNEPIPPNVIENTNVLASFSGATPVYADAETSLAQFTVVAPSTETVILAVCDSPTSGKIYGNNKLQFGYIYFNPGSSLAGFFAMIAGNFEVHAGGGINYNQFFMYQAFPWPPQPGDSFFVSTQAPVDQSQGTLGTNNFVFPFVPAPETAF
jgi:hypothetical protein